MQAHRSKQAGFTLIELIVVIVILGILAATALPKFVDFQADAEIAGAKGVAGGLSSASAIQYAAKSAGKTPSPATLSGTAAALCDSTVLSTLLTSGWPADYTVGAAASSGTCSANGNVSCDVGYKGAHSATAGVTCY